MIAAIAGATGLTGSFCLQELLKNDKISEVIAIGRNSTGVNHPKLKEVILKDFRLTEAAKADAFICCLGTTIKKAGSKAAFKAVDLDLPVYLAGALKNYGCNTVAVVSSMGAKASSSIFYSSIKGQMEDSLISMNFKSLAIMRPSIIAGPRKEKRLGEKIGLGFMKFINPILPPSLSNYKYIYASDIAKALVNSAVTGKSGNTVYFSHDVKMLAKSNS